jgi:hypothetical protein
MRRWPRRATTDPDQIRKWWTKAPDSNVAVVLGGGVFALDVDPRNGGDGSLAELIASHGALPVTPTSVTGSGGRHFLFRYPADLKLGNRPGIRPGLDVKGERGYIVAPPSVHPSGGHYRWADGLAPGEVEIAAAPQSLLDLMVKRPARPKAPAPPRPQPQVRGAKPRRVARPDQPDAPAPRRLNPESARRSRGAWPGRSVSTGTSPSTGRRSSD